MFLLLSCWFHGICYRCGAEKEYIVFGPGGGAFVCKECREHNKAEFLTAKEVTAARVRQRNAAFKCEAEMPHGTHSW